MLIKKSLLLLFLLVVPLVARAEPKDVYTFFFIIDGTNRDFVYDNIKNGELPNFKKYFWDDGTVVKNMTTIFPSVSSPSYHSLMTGLLPGHMSVPYLMRYDRLRKKPVDYLSLSGYANTNTDVFNMLSLADGNDNEIYPPTTMFEILGAHGIKSEVLYSAFFKGATYQQPSIPIKVLLETYIQGYLDAPDVLAMNELDMILKRPVNKLPRFFFTALYSSDLFGHDEGHANENVKLNLKLIDRYIGELIKTLKGKGIFDKSYFVIVTDHGMHDIKKVYNLAKVLSKEGYKANGNKVKKNNYDIFACARGVASAQVYVRKPEGKWKDGITLEDMRNYPKRDGTNADLIDFLIKLPSSDIVAIRDGENSVRIFSKTGEATIDRVDVDGESFFKYTPASNSADPLKYVDQPLSRELVDGRMHSSGEWLEHTAESEYPDSVVQLGTIFRDDQAGDIFISASKDWTFLHAKRATHGSLKRDDMYIVTLMRGPTIPKMMIDRGRSIDLFEPMLSWYGIDAKKLPHDGRNIFDTPVPEKNNENYVIADMEDFLLREPRLLQRPDPEGFKRSFLKKFAHYIGNKKVQTALDTEAERRTKYLHTLREKQALLKGKKNWEIQSKYPGLDVRYVRSLIEREIAKTFRDIARIEDVKKISTPKVEFQW